MDARTHGLTGRRLAGEDVDALQELLESVPDYAERITGYPPGAADGLSTLMIVPPDFDPDRKLGLGLWDGGALVAFADLLLGYPQAGVGYLGLLIVHGSRQHQGLGRAMHEEVVREAAQARLERLRLGIVATNAEVAQPFWAALGYRATGEVRPYRYDRLTSTVALWERPLTS
jgi:GNAT superfamily N-acetyltransferase